VSSLFPATLAVFINLNYWTCCTGLQTAQSQLQQTRDVQQRLASGSMNLTNAVDYPVAGAASTVRFDEEESGAQEQDNQAPRSTDIETHISVSSGPASASSTAVTEVPAEPMETSQAPTTTPTTTLSTAAEIAAKLTASASSAAMLTSVLSSLAAEEASNGLHSSNFGMEGAQKRPRLENHADQIPSPAPVPYQLPPHLSQFLGNASMLPPGYMYQTAMAPPPPPMQSHMMLAQHSMGPPPPPMPPGCNPMYQFQQSPSPYYSPPPVPAPPAPAPRQ
jgi:regulator of Ty1 transposition protein 103